MVVAIIIVAIVGATADDIADVKLAAVLHAIADVLDAISGTFSEADTLVDTTLETLTDISTQTIQELWDLGLYFGTNKLIQGFTAYQKCWEFLLGFLCQMFRIHEWLRVSTNLMMQS